MKKITTFQKFVRFLDELKVGECFCRKTGPLRRIDERVFNTYQGIFCRAGYIRRVSCGVYSKMRNVPAGSTWTTITNEMKRRKRVF